MAFLTTGFRARIEHLQGRENALEPFGWIGRKAEWIALARLHGDGVFTREQLAFYLQMSRWQALRFVQALVTKGMATEDIPEDQKVCRIFNRQIFHALGAEDIRHRPVASRDILFRRMILADYGLTIALYPGLVLGAVAPLLYRVARPARLADLGIDSDAKEAIAFAILAYESFHGRPVNLTRNVDWGRNRIYAPCRRQ